jgi:hypothetical protein
MKAVQLNPYIKKLDAKVLSRSSERFSSLSTNRLLTAMLAIQPEFQIGLIARQYLQ